MANENENKRVKGSDWISNDTSPTVQTAYYSDFRSIHDSPNVERREKIVWNMSIDAKHDSKYKIMNQLTPLAVSIRINTASSWLLIYKRSNFQINYSFLARWKKRIEL